MKDGAASSGCKAVLTKGQEELDRAGRMAAWTRAFGKNDAWNPWEVERYAKSRTLFSPLDTRFYLMTWDGDEYSLGRELPPKTWSTGSRRYNIDRGDRVILLRQTAKPVGIVALGAITGLVQEVPHLDPARSEVGETSLVVPVRWDYFGQEPVLVREDFPTDIAASIRWDARGSGTDIEAVGLLIDQEFRKAIARETQNAAAEREITVDPSLAPTEKETLIKARLGQGKFRSNVLAIERHGCRLTGITDIRHLRASHIKPWTVCNNEERLDGCNGLMLSPAADHLFDKGFMSFADNGDVLIAPDNLGSTNLRQFGLARTRNVGTFTRRQQHYLAYHRAYVLKR